MKKHLLGAGKIDKERLKYFSFNYSTFLNSKDFISYSIKIPFPCNTLEIPS